MRHLSERNTGPVSGRRKQLTLGGRKRVKPQSKISERVHEPQPGEVAARLDRLADVRRSVVARGKILVANPDYPGPKVTRAVARLLAKHWRR